MGDVVDFKKPGGGQQPPSTPPTIQEWMRGSLANIDEKLRCGIVLLMAEDGQVLTGYFNTNFASEAIMCKTLDVDILNRFNNSEVGGTDE